MLDKGNPKGLCKIEFDAPKYAGQSAAVGGDYSRLSIIFWSS
jgi:hypothetical protein